MADESPEITYEKWFRACHRSWTARNSPSAVGVGSGQVIRTWAREGVIPSHRAPGTRKFKFLRYENFEWLGENRYEPKDDETQASRTA